MKKLLMMALVLVQVPFLTAYGETAFKAADQSLLILPTAYTMPAGNSTFTDYEIFLLQYAYAPTNTTHLSIAMPFPVVWDVVKYSALGIKQNYLQYDKMQCAFSVTWLPKAKGGGLLHILSYGDKHANAHVYVGMSMSYKEINQGAFLAAGGLVNLSSRLDLMSEIMTLSEAIDEEGGQLVTLGIRFKGDRISWDLGGMRPLSADTGDLIMIPVIKMSVLF